MERDPLSDGMGCDCLITDHIRNCDHDISCMVYDLRYVFLLASDLRSDQLHLQNHQGKKNCMASFCSDGRIRRGSIFNPMTMIRIMMQIVSIYIDGIIM